MSVSDPLLKELKVFILEFRTKAETVHDIEPHLEYFCKVLERIFRKGVKSSSGWFSSVDYWTWISRLPNQAAIANARINPIFQLAVSTVKDCKKTQNTQGRGRLFLRAALKKKVLAVPVEMLHRRQHLMQEWYDSGQSIIGNEILCEILLSLLFQLTEINFNLNLKNASFLDESWKLPIYRLFEFVPCKDLGIHFQYIDGRSVVLAVDSGSVAEEDNKIRPGDILDDLFNVALKGVKRGKIQNLMKDHQGWPVYMGVIKCRYADGSFFQPFVTFLKNSDVEIETFKDILKESDKQEAVKKRCPMPLHAQLPDADSDQVPIVGPMLGAEERITYDAYYIDQMILGTDGRVCRIEDAVINVITNTSKDKIPVTIELAETEVIVYRKNEKMEICRHSYTEISACGRRTDYLLNFAYIAGETTCSIAKQFCCHVFEAHTDEEAKTILYSLAQGFGRTQWCL